MVVRLVFFRAAAVPEPIPAGKFLSSRISSSITYFYAPFSGDSACSDNVPLRNSSSSSSSFPHSHVDTTTPSQHRLDVSPAPRPLLLFFSWLGAQPGPVSKYRDLYLHRGLDVLVIQSAVMHFLWPRWGLSYGLEVLKLLEEPQFSGRAVLVHATSIGGYTFTQILTHIARGRKEHAGLAQRVIGHIYDSLVFGTLEHMAIGECKCCGSGYACVPDTAQAFKYFTLQLPYWCSPEVGLQPVMHPKHLTSFNVCRNA